MAKTSDITIEILKQIRDEVRQTNIRLGGVSERLDGVAERLDGVSERLDGVSERVERVEKRQTESEIHLATEIVAVVGAVSSLRDAILEDRQLRGQLADHESRLRMLERRTG
jgi:hypothetical protein